MRIIKEGRLPENDEKEATCYNCKTVFTYTKADIKPDQRDGEYVECPLCKKFLSTSSNNFLTGNFEGK